MKKKIIPEQKTTSAKPKAVRKTPKPKVENNGGVQKKSNDGDKGKTSPANEAANEDGDEMPFLPAQTQTCLNNLKTGLAKYKVGLVTYKVPNPGVAADEIEKYKTLDSGYAAFTAALSTAGLIAIVTAWRKYEMILLNEFYRLLCDAFEELPHVVRILKALWDIITVLYEKLSSHFPAKLGKLDSDAQTAIRKALQKQQAPMAPINVFNEVENGINIEDMLELMKNSTKAPKAGGVGSQQWTEEQKQTAKKELLTQISTEFPAEGKEFTELITCMLDETKGRSEREKAANDLKEKMMKKLYEKKPDAAPGAELKELVQRMEADLKKPVQDFERILEKELLEKESRDAVAL